jgi:hypothetical protein
VSASMILHRCRNVSTWASVVLCATVVWGQTSITAAEAKNHVGEKGTVCGQVVSTHYAASTRGRPTFINLDKPYPNQIFTVVIWGNDRGKFGDPEKKYADKRICATGNISDYRGTPEIVAYQPPQIQIQ